MGVLCFFKGGRRLMTVAGKLDNSLREGGLLVIQEMRLAPEVEDRVWVRWLNEGAFHLCNFFDRRTRFRMLSQMVCQEYVTAVFQKSPEYIRRSWWRALIPVRVKTIRRQVRIFQGLETLPFRERLVVTKRLTAAACNSLISAGGLNQLRELTALMDRESIPGDFVECGVYRGGSALILGHAMSESALQRHLWLFDSFEGLPPAGEKDGPAAAQMGKGRLKADTTELKKLLLGHGVPAERTFIVPGWFGDTLHQAPIKSIALLHIDADWYSSVKQCLQDFYHLVSPGGIVILDDYDEWPGCKTAVDGFLSEKGGGIVLEGGGGVPYYFRKNG
jgi:O-methyltransferase